MSKILVKYIRDKDRQPRGCVVAIGAGKVGWSQCNTQYDNFSKQRGKDIALGRAKSEKWLDSPPTFPAKIDGEDLVMNEFYHMVDRSKRYYKNIQLIWQSFFTQICLSGNSIG